MKLDHVTEESIKMLVDQFYVKVRADKNLGPVFDGVIGDTTDAWGPHLKKMYDFWSSLMLQSGRFKGNPHQKHKDLPTFDTGLFDRWLALFHETAQSIHTDEIADQYIKKSTMIAYSLKLSVEQGQRERNETITK